MIAKKQVIAKKKEEGGEARVPRAPSKSVSASMTEFFCFIILKGVCVLYVISTTTVQHL